MLSSRIALPIFCLFLACPLAQATDSLGIPWKQQQFSYQAQDQDVAKTLEKACSALGVQPVISKAVSGKISGRFDAVDVDQFFLTVTQACGLIWYYDGNALYIYAGSELTNARVPVSDVTMDSLEKAFTDLGAPLNRKDLYVKITEGTLYVSGPPRYVDLVKEVATGLADITQSEPDGIEIFRLKQAWAYDTTYSANGSQITIPGVSTILQNLLPSYAGGNYSPSAPITQSLSSAMPKLTATSVQNPQNNPVVPAPHPYSSSGVSSQGTTNGGGAASATGEAVLPNPNTSSQSASTVTYDVRLNAVIVHDTKERLKTYEKVIADLDRPVRIVQINASIVDINTTYALSYGNQFLFKNNSIGAALTPANNNAFNSSTTSPVDAVTSGALTTAGNLLSAGGFTVGSVILNSSVQFLGGINVLQQNGLAHVLSQPSVVTLDNLQAVIQRSSTFYVKIPGTYSTDLYNVNSGTVLTVTPHLVDMPDGKPNIKLIVQINDGAVDNNTGDQVGGLPTTTSDSLNTQAVLKENQSLLVGGIVREDNESQDNGVPGLKDIPLIGPLFKQRTKSKVMLKRLFLITPTIVTASYDTDNLKPYFKTLQEESPGSAQPTPNLHATPKTDMQLEPVAPPKLSNTAQPVPSASTPVGAQ